jgi:hypothetical protein
MEDLGEGEGMVWYERFGVSRNATNGKNAVEIVVRDGSFEVRLHLR